MTASRRGFLGHMAGFASVAAVASVPAALTNQQRLEKAVEELKEAASLAYPQIKDWTVAIGASHRCPIVVAAVDFTGNDGFVKPADA